MDGAAAFECGAKIDVANGFDAGRLRASHLIRRILGLDRALRRGGIARPRRYCGWSLRSRLRFDDRFRGSAEAPRLALALADFGGSECLHGCADELIPTAALRTSLTLVTADV